MTITIRRGPLPTDHFTIISNAWVRDASLSWAARGLLAWMQSHADGFHITEEGIIGAGPVERAGVRTMTRALEDAGYLRRERTPIVTGGSSVSYVLIDPRGGENRPLGNDGKTPPRSDQAEQDVSAGEPRGGKTPPRSLLEDQEKTNTKTSSSLRAARSTMTATRLPDGFMPDEKMRAWFADEKLAAVIDGRIEHEKFVDYFAGAPGVKGRKVDWPATWRNWMRTAAERAPRRPGNALAPISGAPYKPSTTDARISQGMALAAKYEEQGL
jgi:hypothetical protein